MHLRAQSLSGTGGCSYTPDGLKIVQTGTVTVGRNLGSGNVGEGNIRFEGEVFGLHNLMAPTSEP